MKTTEIKFSLPFLKMDVEFLVRVPVPPILGNWGVPEVTYRIFCRTQNHLEAARLAWLNGTIPIDVFGEVDERVVVLAVRDCVELVAWGLNEGWALSTNIGVHSLGPRELPSPHAFNAALFTLLNALLAGAEDLHAHSHLASLLIPVSARLPSMASWAHKGEEGTKKRCRLQGYVGPFWIDAVRRVRDAKGVSAEK